MKDLLKKRDLKTGLKKANCCLGVNKTTADTKKTLNPVNLSCKLVKSSQSIGTILSRNEISDLNHAELLDKMEISLLLCSNVFFFKSL